MAGLAVAATSGVGAAAPARATQLTWTSCQGGFQCATARVPLDYRHPGGAKISIALIRHLATDPAHRIGSLFINTGGPNPQLDLFPDAIYPQIPAALRERYDTITFDPRGFGHSTAVRCFPTEAAENSFFSNVPPFPVGAKQDAQWERTYARFDALCAARSGSLLDHDTSADVARDLDVLRQAVGAPVLNFLALSYGTGLGAIYANLFPGNVGHMVLDGNLPPVTWSSDDRSLPESLRDHSDQASASAMAGFLTLCGRASTPTCAFSAGSPAATRAKWNTLLGRLLRHPVTIGSPPQTVTYADIISSALPGIVAEWPQAAVQLQQAWTASSGNPATPAKRATTATIAPAYTGQEQTLAEFCSDTSNPRNPGDYPAIAQRAAARSGGFGMLLTWADEPCAQWPGNGSKDRYMGPWNRLTASPILVLGNTGDPATAYQDSVAMAHDLAEARLLTIDQFGHTEGMNQNACATGYEVGYLETGALPPAGTVCQQDTPPFAKTSLSQTTVVLPTRNRSAALSAIPSRRRDRAGRSSVSDSGTTVRS
ncbi:MAG TPA: alpha/beta fold hydrolase [Streptosporangiaceae bacterium]